MKLLIAFSVLTLFVGIISTALMIIGLVMQHNATIVYIVLSFLTIGVSLGLVASALYALIEIFKSNSTK